MAMKRDSNGQTSNERPEREKSQPSPAGLSRRRMLGQMAGGLAGASLALPLAAEAATVRNARFAASPLPDSPADEAAAEDARAAAWQPKFLDAHQVSTLMAIGERVAPGAAGAKAHEFIDLLLSVIPPEAEQHFRTGNNVPRGTVRVGPRARQGLLDALSAFDAQARRRHGRPFQQLTAAQQDALLSAAEAAPDDSPTHRHFLAARNWVLGAFYSSEPGIKTLGWTGQLFFPNYPNCAAL
ncbi:MAG: gluconate 2-dehydrogenase subunit 3 family protein [Terriglobales bacterium]